MKSSSFIACDGTSINAWRVVHLAYPEYLPKVLNDLCGDMDALGSFTVAMKLRGKGTRRPTLSQVRAIMPLPPLLQLLDYLLSSELHRWIDGHLPLPDGCFSGAVPGTQPTDMTHGCSLLLQKAEDDYGRGAIAQGDVEKFFDSISPIRVGRFLLTQGCPPWLVGACVSFQLCVRLCFRIGEEDVLLARRWSGCLTGSRVAACCGRVITHDCMRTAAKSRGLRPLSSDAGVVTFSCWVDNLYSAGMCAADAVRNLSCFEAHLLAFWNLRLKADSKTFITANHRRDAGSRLGAWRWACPFIVLGHRVGRGGGSADDQAHAEEACWTRFWCGAGSRQATRMSVSARIRDIERTCWPGVSWRATWWSLNKTTATSIDRWQRQLVGTVLRVPRLDSEDDAAYARRRGHECARAIGCAGAWSQKAAKRTLTWDAHIRRAHVRSWATILIQHKGSAWLIARRLAQKSASAFAGRLSSRVAPERPRTRWEEGVGYAHHLCPRGFEA